MTDKWVPRLGRAVIKSIEFRMGGFIGYPCKKCYKIYTNKPDDTYICNNILKCPNIDEIIKTVHDSTGIDVLSLKDFMNNLHVDQNVMDKLIEYHRVIKPKDFICDYSGDDIFECSCGGPPDRLDDCLCLYECICRRDCEDNPVGHYEPINASMLTKYFYFNGCDEKFVNRYTCGGNEFNYVNSPGVLIDRVDSKYLEIWEELEKCKEQEKKELEQEKKQNKDRQKRKYENITRNEHLLIVDDDIKKRMSKLARMSRR